MDQATVDMLKEELEHVPEDVKNQVDAEIAKLPADLKAKVEESLPASWNDRTAVADRTFVFYTG